MNLCKSLVVGIALIFVQSCVVAPRQPSPPVKAEPRPRPPAVPMPKSVEQNPPRGSVVTAPIDISAPPTPMELPREPQIIGASPEFTSGSDGSVAAPAPVQQAPVIVSLLDQSDLYAGQGEHARAAASLERGLRIEPRNAHLWSRLAKIRLQQKRYDQVESLAKKSNRFAQGESGLIAENWRIIAEARTLRGDTAGAAAAKQKAAGY